MPAYKSQAQEAYFNANRSELEKNGVNVDAWNKASKGMKLPEHVPTRKPKKAKKHLRGVRSLPSR